MALDPADRDLLRIYADPSLSPTDKQRLLGGDSGIPMPAPLPPEVASLPAGAVAGPGGGAGGTSGADDAGPGNVPAARPASSGAGGAPSVDTISGAQTGVVGGGADIPVTGASSEPSADDRRKQLAATLSPIEFEAAKAEHPELFPPGPQPGDTTLASAGGAPGAAPPGGGDYRGALRLMTSAGAATPMDHVQQSTNVTSSSVDPAQIAALGEAQEKRDADAMQAQIAEARIAQQSGDVQLAAERSAQAEKTALAATREKALARADQILARQDQISNEIVNTKPLEPGLMASKNFGDALFTVVSLMFSGLAANGQNDVRAAVEKLANSEVNQQQRELEKKRGDVSELGNLYERHLANLKDHELAKSATIADIYGRAQAEIQQMIQENGQAPDSLINRKLQAQASALGAQRAEYMANVQAKLGPQIQQQEAISFVRKHVEPKAVAPAAAPGAAPVPGAAKPAGPTTLANAAPKKPEEALNQAAELWNSGRPREALALLPPTVKAAVMAQAARTQKEFGESGKGREEALAYALHDMSNGQFQIPPSFIPQEKREFLVQVPGGQQGFATSKSQADKLQSEFNADQSLVSAYSQLEQLTKLPASAWTPELRARIDAITTIIKPMTSVSLGQGAMSTEEQTLYNGVSGGDINSIKDFMLGTGKAMAHQALQIARSRIRARARSLSRDPFDFTPLEGN